MLRKLLLPLTAATIAATCILAPAAAGKNEAWKDTEGNRFKGEASEVLGPLALFRTSSRSGRTVLLHLLTAEDCVRFYQQTREKPARADDWSKAGGELSRQLFGGVQRLEDGHLVAADLTGRPEPEFFILLFGTSSNGKSWNMAGWTTSQLYTSLQQKYPGMAEAVFWAPQDEPSSQEKMAVTMNMPWLVVAYAARMNLQSIRDLVPDNDFKMVVVSRDGVPLFTSPADTEAAIKKIFADLSGLLDLMQPGNPLAWKDRAWYLQCVQPIAHAGDRADPVLVGDPLNAEALRKAGVLHFDAAIKVAAGGAVRHISFIKPEKDLKPEMAQAIGHALLQALFVPAVDHGKFVDGVYEYHFGTR